MEDWVADNLAPTQRDYNTFVNNVVLQDIKVLNAFDAKFYYVLKHYPGSRNEEFKIWRRKLMSF
jgi:hypothetical protein